MVQCQTLCYQENIESFSKGQISYHIAMQLVIQIHNILFFWQKNIYITVAPGLCFQCGVCHVHDEAVSLLTLNQQRQQTARN